MKQIFIILQLIFSLGLISLVLLQAKGSGMGNVFGGLQRYHSQKGLEKVIQITTVISAALFLITSLVNAFLV